MTTKFKKIKGVWTDTSIPGKDRLTRKQIEQAKRRLFGKPKKIARIFKPYLRKIIPMTFEEEQEWLDQMIKYIESPYDESGNRKKMPTKPKGKTFMIR